MNTKNLFKNKDKTTEAPQDVRNCGTKGNTLTKFVN